MNVYISTDMEGTAGVVGWDQVMPGKSGYEQTRQLQIREVNSAIEGAIRAGAERVLVADLHCGGHNFPLNLLHSEAEFYTGSRPPYTRFPCMEEGFDLLFCIGYHAMANVPGAILSHTMSGVYMWIKLNGREIGELAMDALWAGLHNVGVGMVSGDAALCGEARELLGPDVETAQVKRGMSRYGGLIIAPERAAELIWNAAENAVKKAAGHKPTPLREVAPYTIEMELESQELTEKKLSLIAEAERTGPRTIAVSGNDLNQLMFDVLV